MLYESFAGNGVLCNPEAIFRHLLDDPEFGRLRHVWAISDDAAIARFTAEFGSHPRVDFVRRGSGRYWEALSTSGTLVNNSTFPAAFGKRAGQRYLNTWHGTPLKRMGFDMPDGARQSANVLRNLLMADYLLAANPFMSETMYEGAYRLDNIYGGELIEEGYPRVDRQRLTDAQVDAVRAELEAAGVRLGDRRIVLYAPTWRGGSFAQPEADFQSLLAHASEMQQAIGGDAVLLVKTHQVVHALAAGHPGFERILAPNTIPTNVLLGAASALITDYSSIFFDYLATGRPVVFFTPDADGYADTRGTYLPLDELPGPVVADAAAAAAAARRLLDDGTPHPRYAEWAQRFTPYEDGGATERVVDIVFRGRRDGYRVRGTERDGRRRLLFYLGGMQANGITSSALNLLRQIDHERYDVTALMPHVKSADQRAGQALIDPRVRQIMRVGGMSGSKLFHLLRRRRDLVSSVPQPGTAPWHDRLWHDEWDRLMGSAAFDWVADFSGYSPFWTNLLLRSPDAPRAVWLHNELASDRTKTVNGRQPHKRGLGIVFNLYRSFDQLVSVSHQLTAVNREQLSEFADAHRFVTVRNFPSPEAIPSPGADARDLLEPDEAEPYWMRELRDGRRSTRWFVTIGRLSPEKNHARLIRAFAEVHAADPSTRLLILGSGALQGALEQQIMDAGLAEAAFLGGHRRRPTALLAAADCFVLSSDYEGQPMVLLEAALCELPIVSTAFASVADALPDDTIRVVDCDDASLRDGMLAFLAGEVPSSRLDYDAYVRDVTAELERVVDAAPREG